MVNLEVENRMIMSLDEMINEVALLDKYEYKVRADEN